MTGTFDIYVINLDRSPDRLSIISNLLQMHGVPFHRISAVDGNDLSDPDALRDIGRFSVDGGEVLSATQVAITRSHLKALGAFLESGTDYALVLEDDAFFDASLFRFLEEFAARTAEFGKFDGLELSGSGSRSADFILPLTSLQGYTVGKARKLTPVAAGMLYSRRGAQKLIRNGSPVTTHWDNYLSLTWKHRADILTVRPYLVTQNPSLRSTYHAEKVSEPPAATPLQTALRLLHRLYQGPKRFLSDLRWVGVRGLLRHPSVWRHHPQRAFEAAAEPGE